VLCPVGLNDRDLVDCLAPPDEKGNPKERSETVSTRYVRGVPELSCNLAIDGYWLVDLPDWERIRQFQGVIPHVTFS